MAVLFGRTVRAVSVIPYLKKNGADFTLLKTRLILEPDEPHPV